MNQPVLHLGSRLLLVDGPALEVFDGLRSMGRVLLLGATVALEGPDRKGRYELTVRDDARHLYHGERVEAADLPRATAFLGALSAAGARAPGASPHVS